MELRGSTLSLATREFRNRPAARSLLNETTRLVGFGSPALAGLLTTPILDGNLMAEPEGAPMSNEDLEELIKRARKVPMSSADKEAQRRSFVYGNTNIENEAISRETVERAAKALSSEDK